MTPERWDQISEIFSAILELHPSEREAYLDKTCADDTELRNEVEGLLARNEQASREKFLEERVPWNPSEHRDDEGEMVGRRIGPYEIVRFLDGGGMGDVYLAVRVEPFKKRVAIKFIKPIPTPCPLYVVAISQRSPPVYVYLSRLSSKGTKLIFTFRFNTDAT